MTIRSQNIDELIEQGDNLKTLAEARQESLPLPWTITEAEFVLEQHHRDVTLDQILEQECAPSPHHSTTWDRCIWKGTRIVAVVQTSGGGKPKVVRILPRTK